MCGIAGIITPSARYQPIHRQQVQAVSSQLQARGPDHQALCEIQTTKITAVLAHNRLSIIDLSDNANQPMWDVTKRYCLVFNGMIYNYLELRSQLAGQGYSFQTQSDSEVILAIIAERGLAGLNELVGMFAFALFDKKEQSLLLARDRFGVKPLYYVKNQEQLSFASTSAPLAKLHQLPLNQHLLADAANTWLYDQNNGETIYQGLNELPGGHYLIAKLAEGAITTDCQPYYSLKEQVAKKREIQQHLSDKALCEQTFDLLQQSIELRLRADVPIAISLSGGLDSSLVSALCYQKDNNLSAFVFGDANNKRSEAPLAKQLTNKLGMNSHFIALSDLDKTSTFWRCINAQHAPIPNLSPMAQHAVFAAMRERNVKVALGGQGGDEAFLGYRKFFIAYAKTLFQQKNYAACLQLLLTSLPAVVADTPRLMAYWHSFRRYIPQKGSAMPHALASGIETRQLQDITTLSLPSLLRYEDRNSMDNSIETRLPFLHHPLVEWAVALPTHLKIKQGYGKWLLRQFARPLLPKAISHARYKRGFDSSSSDWFDAKLCHSVSQHLLDKQSQFSHYFACDNELEKIFSVKSWWRKPDTLRRVLFFAWLTSCDRI